MSFTLQAIAERLGGVLDGDGGLVITGVSGLQDARPGDLSFVTDARYEKLIEETRASALLVGKEFGACRLPVIRCAQPEIALEVLAECFRPARAEPSGQVDAAAQVAASARLGAAVTVMPFAFVGDAAEIGDRSVLFPGVYVGAHAAIGADCVLHPNVVVLDRVRIGARVVIHAGSVLGADGFGYRPVPEGLCKIEHIGTVEVEDDVEIGACVAIDRARFGRTLIGRGAKIDNLVQVAHNVRVGRGTAIAAQTGVSGSTTIGDACMIGGQAGIVGHIRIGDRTLVAARAGVSKDVKEGSILYGYHARQHLDKKREDAALRRLPKLLERVRELEARVRALEAARKADGESPAD
ncbi:MAG: UDP-3-O-(3-hydroxymyristoyl)glucosamine N-acyltransferase [Planctomycetes bacterium]|nr:UDP-3-O-(3-hydroxymyristoyl)glucosamine N-acyltransferase [Planctomycetota bacterium]